MTDDAKVNQRETTADDGVDLTLINWSLSLTPEDRLSALQGFVDSVAELRREPSSR